MNILSFESSCDETSAAVLCAAQEEIRILSNVVASQIETHRLYGGVVPEIASRAHSEAISPITYEALERAGVTMADIDLIAVTSHPGLIGALLVAVNFAKSLAERYGIPLVAVDHIKGHVAANYLKTDEGHLLPKPPFLALAVSGGHTAFYLADSYTSMKVVGTTRDDAIGESFDKIGRLIGIPYPAGAGFDALATEGFSLAAGKERPSFKEYKKSAAYKDPEMVLPSPALSDGSGDLSFSGLKTAAMNLLHHYEQTGKELPRALFAARYTYEAVEAVAKTADRLMTQYSPTAFLVAGGVAANSHLRRRLAEIADRHGCRMWIPPLSLCGDNAAMIGAQGYYEYLAGHLADATLNASALDD